MSSNTEAVKDLVRDAIVKGAVAAADSRDTGMQRTDVRTVTSKVLNEVAPIILNATNNEPWYQSRVIWGSIVAIAAPIVAPLIGYLAGETVTITPEDQAAISSWLALVGSAAGGLFALYGRLIAKKPLGQ